MTLKNRKLEWLFNIRLSRFHSKAYCQGYFEVYCLVSNIWGVPKELSGLLNLNSFVVRLKVFV